jgi:SAM-dependent methyltransferase
MTTTSTPRWLRQARVKQVLLDSYNASRRQCRASIIDAAPHLAGGRYLDCGCDDGSFTLDVAGALRPRELLGIEIDDAAADRARARGIQVVGKDLNDPFPLPDGHVDLVTANQVIEHLADTDGFVREIHRVLKPGGYAVVSTNNLASWHNLAALVLGYQPFPADVSNITSIGKLIPLFAGDGGSWAHLRIFTSASLREIFEYHGFAVERLTGVGYYPFPPSIARRLSRVDHRHAAYLTVRARRP